MIEVTDVLIYMIVVNILQVIHILNHHITCFEIYATLIINLTTKMRGKNGQRIQKMKHEQRKH